MIADNYPPSYPVLDITEEPIRENEMSEQWQYKQIVKAIDRLALVISIIGLAIIITLTALLRL